MPPKEGLPPAADRDSEEDVLVKKGDESLRVFEQDNVSIPPWVTPELRTQLQGLAEWKDFLKLTLKETGSLSKKHLVIFEHELAHVTRNLEKEKKAQGIIKGTPEEPGWQSKFGIKDGDEILPMLQWIMTKQVPSFRENMDTNIISRKLQEEHQTLRTRFQMLKENYNELELTLLAPVERGDQKKLQESVRKYYVDAKNFVAKWDDLVQKIAREIHGCASVPEKAFFQVLKSLEQPISKILRPVPEGHPHKKLLMDLRREMLVHQYVVRLWLKTKYSFIRGDGARDGDEYRVAAVDAEAFQKYVADFLLCMSRYNVFFDGKSANEGSLLVAFGGLFLQELYEEAGEHTGEVAAKIGTVKFGSGFVNLPEKMRGHIVQRLMPHVAQEGFMMMDATFLQKLSPDSFQKLLDAFNKKLGRKGVWAFKNFQSLPPDRAQTLLSKMKDIKPNLFIHSIEDLEELPPKMRRAIGRALPTVRDQLLKEGYKVEELNRLLGRVRWREIMGLPIVNEMLDVIGNPVTFLIFLLYLSTCNDEDKLKGAIRLTTYYGLSIAAGRLNKVTAWLTEKIGAKVGAKVAAETVARCMRSFGGGFVLVLGLIFVLDQYTPVVGSTVNGVEAFLRWMGVADEAEALVAFAFLNNVQKAARDQLLQMDFVTFDPEQDFNKYFLTPENPAHKGSLKGVIEQKYYRTIEMWNDLLRTRINKLEGKVRDTSIPPNLVEARRFRLHLIDADRVSRLCADYYVVFEDALRSALNMENAMRKTALENEIPVEEYEAAIKEILAVVKSGGLLYEGQARNEKVLAERIRSASSAVGKMDRKVRALRSGNSLLPLWERYLHNAQEHARLTGLYRHMRLPLSGTCIYNEQEWTESRGIDKKTGKPIPPALAQKGFLQEFISAARLADIADQECNKNPLAGAIQVLGDTFRGFPGGAPPSGFYQSTPQ